jgi:hypothetical protein
MEADTSLQDVLEQDYPLGTAGRGLLAAVGLLLIAGFGLAAAVQPDPRGYGTHQQFGFPPCGFYVLFGVPCPSCGSTTAFANFVRGRWALAAQANFAAFLLALTCAGLVPWSLQSAWRGRLWRVTDPARSLAWLVIALATVSLLQWGVRFATR